MKIELGGGKYPRGEGFLNIDQDEVADVICDLSKGIPLEDDSVDEVYSSHFLEHIPNPHGFLDQEVCRVCKVGALVEIRVPHPMSDLAMTWDHKHVFSEMHVENLDIHFAAASWTPPKRLKHIRTEYGCCEPFFSEAKQLYPHFNDYQIMRFVPRTCHECRFYFRVDPV